MRNPLTNKVNHVKKATWVKYVCVSPNVDQNYLSLQKKLNQLGYVDSLLKYELELIEVADYNLMMRLIEDYILNISSRIRNTIRLTKNKDFNELKSLKNIVQGIVGDSTKNEMEGPNLFDNYTEKVDTDLLKYFLILRFLKMRDLKFYILNLLNYFRYVQKKFAIDLYKIENTNLKKSNDFINMTDSKK
jgi:hypothetical protein